ncbi:MAG: nucleoside deaminase [Clostridia bacterium]|nr:nucleoside deaminase [Clostridia bacterium]
MRTDVEFMALAIKEAKKAYKKDEVPVGAIIVRGDEIIAKAYNTSEYGKNALYHAEIKAIDKACKRLGGWRLVGCTMYVTLEPCPMCAGAIVNSRIERVVYGVPDHKAGAFGTMINLTDYPLYKPQITSGVLADDCAQLLSSFFKSKR